MKAQLLTIATLVAAASCAAQSVEVISSTQTIQTRSRLVSANATYAINEAGTDVVLVTLDLRSATERKIGSGNWVIHSEEIRQFSRADVESWATSYTNAQGAVVTNGIRASFLADIGRIELLPGRWRSIQLVPQATVATNTP